MKKAVVMAAVVLSVFISCKKSSETGTTGITPSSPKDAEIVEPSGNQCFAMRTGTNTIELNFNVNSHQEVNGTLHYNFEGKDKNEGVINGNMLGDTLLAEYRFDSEGVSSVRQVIFLQIEGVLVEGYGDVIQANDMIVFKDRKSIKFDAKNTLMKVNCNN